MAAHLSVRGYGGLSVAGARYPACQAAVSKGFSDQKCPHRFAYAPGSSMVLGPTSMLKVTARIFS